MESTLTLLMIVGMGAILVPLSIRLVRWYMRWSQLKDAPPVRSTTIQPGTSNKTSDQAEGEDLEAFQSEPIRKLTTLDAPMIQARFDKLGVFAGLEPYQQERLRRMIKEHCQQGKEEIWWGPLQEFAKGLRYQKGDMVAHVLVSKAWKVKGIRRDVDTLGYMVRMSRIQLENFTTKEGKALHGEDTVEDGAYRISYKFGDQTNCIPAICRDGHFDIIDMVRQLNGLFRRLRTPKRLLLLPPWDENWCVVWTDIPAAERAASAKWGRLLYPRR